MILVCLGAILLAACGDEPQAALNPFDQMKIPILATLQPDEETTQEVEAALQRVVEHRDDVVAFLIYKIVVDHVDVSADGNLALAWFGMIDPDVNEMLPGEPGLAIARRVATGSGADNWEIIIQADANWMDALAQVPAEILPDDQRAHYTVDIQAISKAHQVFSGYYLPWQKGKAKRVSGSIGHVLTYKSCPSTCMYAFDFADGTMFSILAARGGTVKYAEWRYENGNTEHTNYLVLEDTTTTPTTYQVYYHMAQDSIPEALRVRGAVVYQGQFIGNADDTGASTGNHLHFHVHTNPNVVFGTSVDITFDDVTDNGGRPRTCTEAAQYPEYGAQCQSGNLYVSGNGDAESPTGGFSQPAANQIITSSTMTVTGWGADDSGIRSMQLMLSYDGTWIPVGAAQSKTPFTQTVDLCTLGVPDGPLFLSLQIVDQSGRSSEGLQGLMQVQKSFNCSPPPTNCVPADDQIAVFASTDFQGVCNTLGLGDLPDSGHFPDVGDNNVQSVRVGANVVAYLYPEANFGGEAYPLAASDSNLGDNTIGADTVSSIRVLNRPAAPSEPLLNDPATALGRTPNDQDVFTLSWDGWAQDLEFRSELTGADGTHAYMDWESSSSTWQVGPLPAGEYNWWVWSRNISGENQASLNFTVDQVNQAPSSQLEALPETTNSTAILLQWTAEDTEGDLARFAIQYRQGEGEWTDWNTNIPAQLRQAWFYGQTGVSYQFRIQAVDYNGNQEGYPETADAATQIEAQCTLDEFDARDGGDNLFSAAAPIPLDQSQSHNICGAGDEDWVSFEAVEGKSYQFNVQPMDGSTAVRIQLYDTDGASPLGEQRPDAAGVAAQFSWIAPLEGTYYLRYSPIDASVYGSDVRYLARIDQQGQIFTPGLFCSGLILPLLYMVVRWFWKAKTPTEEEE
ncbi:MAG: peptidoglycan DD-metalloendopeptidase family protein [Anaerolineaceae bacterium]|nr:peptidoglycan DD-metalloendopeptidase family protein [Anaerolineaceae bacterium]